MGLRGTTRTSLLASGDSRNESLLIASIILPQQTQARRQITYLPLMILITKALCPPAGASTIPFLLLAIQRSAQYQISWLLLLRLLILTIHIRRELNLREGGIIGRMGVTAIGGYLMERDFWRGVSGTAMTVRFSLGGVPTTVNRMDVTALHRIMTHSFVSLDMFSIWIIRNNDDCLG